MGLHVKIILPWSLQSLVLVGVHGYIPRKIAAIHFFWRGSVEIR